MRGSVIAYSNTADAGVIQSEDGKRFYFSRTDCDKTLTIGVNSMVEFVPAFGAAKSIRADI